MTDDMYRPIRQRLAAVTGGPWSVAETETYGRLVWGIGVDYDPRDPSGQTAMQTQASVAQQIPRAADAEFIAHAPADIELLLAEAQLGGEISDTVTAWLDRNGDGIPLLALQELNAALEELHSRHRA